MKCVAELWRLFSYFIVLSSLIVKTELAKGSQDSFFGRNRRTKRGIMSRSGICPHAIDNMEIKDVRINFYGLGFLLPSDDQPPCLLQGCRDDGDCSGNSKCCKNYCGSLVCTPAVRENHPCKLFTCPHEKKCRLRAVKCIQPLCDDIPVFSRAYCFTPGPDQLSSRPHYDLPIQAEDTSLDGDPDSDEESFVRKRSARQSDDSIRNNYDINQSRKGALGG